MEDRPLAAELAELVRGLHCCSRHLRGHLAKHLAPAELSDSEFLLLWTCESRSGESLTQALVAEAIGLSPAQMSGLVDRLRRRELLEVIRSVDDRRRHDLQVTAAGRRAVSTALQCLEMLAAQADRVCSPRQRQDLQRLAQDLAQGLEQSSGPDVAEESRLRHGGAAA